MVGSSPGTPRPTTPCRPFGLGSFRCHRDEGLPPRSGVSGLVSYGVSSVRGREWRETRCRTRAPPTVGTCRLERPFLYTSNLGSSDGRTRLRGRGTVGRRARDTPSWDGTAPTCHSCEAPGDVEPRPAGAGGPPAPNLCVYRPSH